MVADEDDLTVTKTNLSSSFVQACPVARLAKATAARAVEAVLLQYRRQGKRPLAPADAAPRRTSARHAPAPAPTTNSVPTPLPNTATVPASAAAAAQGRDPRRHAGRLLLPEGVHDCYKDGSRNQVESFYSRKPCSCPRACSPDEQHEGGVAHTRAAGARRLAHLLAAPRAHHAHRVRQAGESRRAPVHGVRGAPRGDARLSLIHI